MSKFTLSPEQISHLEQLPAVAKATQRQIVFTQAFKQAALAEFANGKSRRDILYNAGIDVSSLSSEAIKNMFQQWAKQDLSSPPKSKGRPKGPAPTIDPKNMTHDQLLAKLALTQAENEFLKKVLALD
jgi:hypothetical protein